MTVPVPTQINALTWFLLAEGQQGEIVQPPPQMPPTVFVSNTTGQPASYALPLNPTVNQRQQYKDVAGNAGTYPITFYDAAGALIDGQPTFVMRHDYAAYTFVWNGVGWSVT